MNLKVDKGLVVEGIKMLKAGQITGIAFAKKIFPKTFQALEVKPFPKLMIKRYNRKTGDYIGRVCLFLSPNEGRVVVQGNGKYPIGSNGADIKIEYYEELTEAELKKFQGIII